MNNILKYILIIISVFVGIFILYRFVYVPGEEAKKRESAEKAAFFECDSRWEKIPKYVPSQALVDLWDLDCQNRWQLQETYNADIKNGTLPQEIKNNLIDRFPYEFFVDSNLYCYNGRVAPHDRTSYTNMCKNWYLLNVGIDPWPGVKTSAENHYH